MEENTLPDTLNEQSLEGDNGIEAPEPTQETPQFITRTEWEERERILKEEFEQRLQHQTRQAQSKADKARDNATRRQKALLTETVPLLRNAGVEIDPETIGRISNQIREQEFWETSTQAVNEDAPQVNYVTKSALEGYLTRRGLSPSAMDLSKYVGLEDTDPKGADFYTQVENLVAKNRQDAAAAQASNKVNEAQKVAAVKRNYGGTATPSGSVGASTNASGLQQEMADLLKKTPRDFNERASINARIKEVEQELIKLGQWGSQK